MAQNIANRGFGDKSHYNVWSAPVNKRRRGGVSPVLLAALVWEEKKARWSQENQYTEKDSARKPHLSIEKKKKNVGVNLIALSEGHQKTGLLIGRTKQTEGHVQPGWPRSAFTPVSRHWKSVFIAKRHALQLLHCLLHKD